jgi:DNA-directed RNA polymerase subunit RPC12/RpoP
VSTQPARGTDPLAPRLVSAAHLADDDAVRVHQCMRCAAEVPATPERVTDLPADERADPALARLDCPQCGAKRSALLTVTCPKCRNRFVPPTVRTLIELAEGREDETEYAWPRDVCPHCGTDVIEHLRKPKTTTTSGPLDASSRE